MIQINDKLRIVRLDKYCLQLEEYRKVTSRTKGEHYKWCWVGYYGDLKSAISGVLKHFTSLLVDEEINGYKAVLEKLDTIENEMRNATQNNKI